MPSPVPSNLKIDESFDRRQCMLAAVCLVSGRECGAGGAAATLQNCDAPVIFGAEAPDRMI